MFRAELTPVTKRDLGAGAELITAFMRKAEGLRPDDIQRFWTVFEQFAPAAPPTLSALWSFYESFKWGDDIEPDE